MTAPPRLRSRIALAALALICAAPLAMGGALASFRVAIVVAVALAALTVAFAERSLDPGREYRLAMAAAGIPMVMGALQLAPMPCGVVERLTGHEAAFPLRVAELSGRPARCQLSMDAPSTSAALGVDGCCLLACFVGARARRRAGARAALTAVAAPSMALLVVTLGHQVLDLDRVYGVLQPEHAGFGLLGPLLNGNHLAALAVACVPLGLALARPGNTGRRFFGSVTAGVGALVAVLAMSRGGLVTLALVVPASAYLLGRRSKGVSASRPVVGAVAVVALAVAAMSAETIAHDFREGPYKWHLLRSALAFGAGAPLVGHGRGAFATAFVGASDASHRPEFAENLVAQTMTELGPLIGALTVGLLVAAAVGGAQRGRSTTVALARLALVSLLVHDLGDFALELPGLRCVFFALLGVVGTSRGGSRGAEPDPASTGVGSAWRRPSTWAVGGALLAAFVGTARASGHDRDVARGEAMRALRSAERTKARRVTTAMVASHPYDPVALVLAAEACALDRAPCALGFANLAMRRAPAWPAPHEAAYRYLATTGRRAQAVAELRAIAVGSPSHAAELFCRLPMAVENSVLVRAIASADQAPTFLAIVARCLDAPSVVRLGRAAEERFPSPALHAELARAVQRSEGPAAALAFLDAGGRTLSDAGVQLERARLLDLLGRPAEALTAIDAARRGNVPRDALDELEALAAAAAGDASRSAAAVRRLEEASTDLAHAREVAGKCAERLGDDATAANRYSEAYTLEPTEARLRDVERVSERAGLAGRLQWARERRCADFGCER